MRMRSGSLRWKMETVSPVFRLTSIKEKKRNCTSGGSWTNPAGAPKRMRRAKPVRSRTHPFRPPSAMPRVPA